MSDGSKDELEEPVHGTPSVNGSTASILERWSSSRQDRVFPNNTLARYLLNFRRIFIKLGSKIHSNHTHREIIIAPY